MSWTETKAFCFSVLFFTTFILTVVNVTGINQCLQDEKEIKPRRFLQIENDIYEITLATSSSTGHQLLTHAFKIFVEEILGYDSVKITYHEDHFNATIALNRFNDEPEDRVFGVNPGEQRRRVPETMINLGVWVSRDTDLQEWIRTGYLESCGHVGFYGKFGWYIPRNTSLLLGNDDLPLDYWRTYVENEEIISYFTLDQEEFTHASQLLKNDNDEYFCKETYCTNGMFIPEICKNGEETCATLLNSFPESSAQLSHQITSLGMRVQVMYLGHNLEKFAFSLYEKHSNSGKRKSILVYSWNPTWLTSQIDPISISFPGEESYYYETAKLEKVAWNELKKVTSAKLLHETTHRFSLNQEDYVSFLKLHNEIITENPKAEMSAIACAWLKKNKDVWKFWKSSSDVEKIPLYIGGIFPINGTYMDVGIVRAAIMATNAVNSNSSVLNGYHLQLFASDGQCRADMVMKSFIDYIRLPEFPTMAGILGPACSDTVEPLAGVATHFKTVVISYSAEGSTFSDREKYPYFFRTIGENKQYQHVYLKLFQRLGWRRVASLTEEGQKYAEYVSHLQDLLQENKITYIANRKFPREKLALNMSQYLQDLKSKKAKIIIGDFYDHAARAVMCEAFRQKMTAMEGYVWFLPSWFNDEWFDTDRYNGISGKEPIPCNTSEMIQAINGHLSLQHAYFAPDDHIMQENITVREWRERYTKICNTSNVTASDYGGYAYDAVWTYAYALDELLKQNHSHITNLHSANTTRNFVEIINTTDFYGVSGRIQFIGGPSRLSVIRVVQWVDRKKRIIGSFNPIPKNDSSQPDNGILQLNKSSIVWLNPLNEIPDDGTEPPQGCVLETLANALDVTCEIAIVIVNVIGFGILGLILVVCFIVIKRRYDKRAKWTEDYFKSLGIDIHVTNVSALDKWEIPRDRVVINRKLGEGAFGTVYGGECFFDTKGWTAVAVKTLKVGSSLEQKLDFLSEAEVMKRFDHKNIIKLLGVCTKNEPVYTVMEFMLYGDLKTYLLARRHLVNEGDFEESDEISSKRLTAMTLDVARALSYLAELKYVHRDVACRNCLVNAFRTVKLGDFGMTRPMYESDYYRFNRKGMLPVRWMAPESLALGIFTPASDVWSFGVLLYEIITFGSFPFQGLSNNQVLDHVKGGNIIIIPDGVKPQLESLLLSCWRYEGVKRPHASEIVEFLANNPRIISPCLDIPLASVQLEGSEVHEIQLPRKRPRKGLSLNRANTSDTNSPGPICPELIPLTTTSTSTDHQSHSLKPNTNRSQNHIQSTSYTSRAN